MKKESVKKAQEDYRIVILLNGWVFAGVWEEQETRVILHDAVCIRRWGTTQGLGELALKGPQKETVLEPVGFLYFKAGSEIASIKCMSAW